MELGVPIKRLMSRKIECIPFVSFLWNFKSFFDLFELVVPIWFLRFEVLSSVISLVQYGVPHLSCFFFFWLKVLLVFRSFCDYQYFTWSLNCFWSFFQLTFSLSFSCSSQFALRSYLYLLFHKVVGGPASWLFTEDKVRCIWISFITLHIYHVTD